MSFKHEDSVIHPGLKQILQRIPIQIFAVDPEFRKAVDEVNQTLWMTNNVLVKVYVLQNFNPEDFECQSSLFEGNWVPKIANQLKQQEGEST